MSTSKEAIWARFITNLKDDSEVIAEDMKDPETMNNPYVLPVWSTVLQHSADEATLRIHHLQVEIATAVIAIKPAPSRFADDEEGFFLSMEALNFRKGACVHCLAEFMADLQDVFAFTVAPPPHGS